MMPGTGFVIHDPSRAREGETAEMGIARGRLLENERIIATVLNSAKDAFEQGNDTDGVLFLEEARTLAMHRAEIAKRFGIENSQQAHDLLKFTKTGFGVIQGAMNGIESKMGYWYQDLWDKGDVSETRSLMEIFDPKRTAQEFLLKAARVDHQLRTTTEGKLMKELGFKVAGLSATGTARGIAQGQDITLSDRGRGGYLWSTEHIPSRLMRQPNYIRPMTDIEKNQRLYLMDKSQPPIIIQGDGQSSNNMTITNQTHIHEDGPISDSTSLMDRQRFMDFSSSHYANPSMQPRH